LRVTTQLLEAATGTVQWAAKFDRPLSELAELQEELVTEIAASLDAQVYSLEMERALRKPGDITAWEATVRSLYGLRKWDAASRAEGIEEAKRAVAIAPEYAPAHASLAYALANAYFAGPDNPEEVHNIRAVIEHAITLAPDDASVLGSVGIAFSLCCLPEEGERYTSRALRKAPGSGLLHYQHGLACAMLNRSEEALSHLKTAERLMPGWHMMWLVKAWQAVALIGLSLWAEADAATAESIRLNPAHGFHYVAKALTLRRSGHHAEVNRQIDLARQNGVDLVMAERIWRRAFLYHPTLEADVAVIRELYTASEPGV
jgi:tetratricopeptide (TPR) repeat protein